MQHEQVQRTEPEQDNRMPTKTVENLAIERFGVIFFDRHGVNVANAALIKISCRRVVHHVRALPNVVRGECKHPEYTSNPVTDPAAFKKPTMAAIMLNDENSD